jgi:transcriptional regulator
MASDRSELLQGTLDLLALKVLSLGPMHGWGISERIRMLSEDVFDVNQGSLYPALQRLKRRGWIRSEWRLSEKNRRARYYELTRAGWKQLEAERAAWRRSSTAVERVLAVAAWPT